MENIDQKEVDKFSDLASRWWDADGELKTLHEINPLRLGFIESHVTLAGKSVLDIGCGGGILSESMASNGANVTGVDASAKAIEVAKLHKHELNLAIDYLHTTAEDFAKQGQLFDVITCMELLEHVPDPKSLLQALSQCLKPRGHLFLSTINRNPKAYLHAIIGAEYILRLLPKGTHDYHKFIKPSELATVLRELNIDIKQMQGLGYNPIRKTYSLNDDVKVNYLLYAQAR